MIPSSQQILKLCMQTHINKSQNRLLYAHAYDVRYDVRYHLSRR